MVYLESIAGAVAAPATEEVDERAARRTLRRQIAHLERDLAAAVIAAYPRLPAGTASISHGGPRLLGLGELERTRDDLADRIAEVREQAAAQGERQAAKRLLIERMLLDPSAYRWVRVSNEDIGEPGCKNWHVVPRLGIVGMLAGWWHVKISSGCPLATPQP
ncbi:MAG TPA: hypothetical protein VEX67_13645 [Solirubrobacteraceae bacterium]|nr:hypothetical protein [Solirubrobacteraceae bacterium]